MMQLTCFKKKTHIKKSDKRGGEIMGWSWLMPHGRWNYYGLALTPVELIQIDAEKIKKHMESDHVFGYEIYKRLYHTVVERLFTTRCFILNPETAGQLSQTE